MPEFTDEVENRTVVAGREAILSCHVQHLGSYKVSDSVRPDASRCVGSVAGRGHIVERSVINHWV